MSRDYRLLLEDIAGSCDKIARYCRGMAFEQFLLDEKTYDAVIRNLEIIGEAAKSIPDHVRSRYTAVEWRKIAGLRDVVAHEYFGIDNLIVWDIVQRKVPMLAALVRDILGQDSSP